MTEPQRTAAAPTAPDSEEREDARDPAGATDDAAGGSGTAGPGSDTKRQAGSYARDAEQDPDGDRHDRADADR